MINFFDRLYSIKYKNSFLEKIRFYAIWRRSIGLLANIILPIYFLVTQNNKNYVLNSMSGAPNYIVSLTTFPLRINRIWLVLESILRQEVKPDKIILWLSKDEFPSYDKLPGLLKKQVKRGVDIRFKSGNLLSHKKYFYSFSEYPDATVITFDDDIFYPSNCIAKLIDFHHKYPNIVVCNRGWKIKCDKMKNQLLPYNQWEFLKTFTSPHINVFATGVGGVLYPSNVLNEDVLNLQIIEETCRYADDIWLNAMALLNNHPCVKTDDDHVIYLPIFYLKNIKLTQKNVENNGNDLQLKKIREYYIINRNIDIYNKVIKKS